MTSRKTAVIEKLFRERYDPYTRKLRNPVVTIAEVADAIREYNGVNPSTLLSDRNPANFFKDFVRVRRSAEKHWPKYVFEQGYTARQVTGKGNCFEFVPISAGQTSPFPVANLSPTSGTPRFPVESVSLPMASRRLGRRDEAWLIQVVVRLRIVEAHFSLASRRAIRQLDLLQMNVKQSATEIDAVYLAHEEAPDGGLREVIVTCEAKRGADDILEDQILQQARTVFSMRQIDQDLVIPLGMKSVGKSQIYIVEFEELDRGTYESVTSLTVASDSLFDIHPPVPGVE